MKVVVQKYGGSSVADLDRLRQVAARVVATRRAGHQVVVVVSAMGNTTNELLDVAQQVSASPGRRELDMLISVGERISMALLSMAIAELGEPAVSFTGSQSGIITDESHASARIVAVRPWRVRDALEQGQIAIVAGFQGVSRDREVTTLGRGGSDLTAVALAAALKAQWCEICSDVDGVYTADPRVVPDAIRLQHMSLNEALAMARSGAQVLYSEAVAYAHREGIELVASATRERTSGTRIQVEELPPRVVAITQDAQLEAFEVAEPSEMLRLLGGAGVPVRRLSHSGQGWRLVVDLRNWHDRAGVTLPQGVSSLGKVAQVTAVSSAVAVDPARLTAALAALAHARVPVLAAAADGGSMHFEVPVDALKQAQRALHTTLVARD